MKYDKTEQKIFLITGSVFSLAFLAALVVAVIADMSGEITGVGITALLVLFFTPLPALACWYAYLDSRAYFKQLRRHGIEPQLHKKDEPAGTAVRHADTALEPVSRESIILSLISCIAGAGLLIWFILYAVKYCSLGAGDAVVFLAAPWLILIILWIVGAAVYFRQRDNRIYKDEGDPAPDKKVRINIFKGVLLIMICLAVSLFACKTMVNMTDYSYRTRLEEIYGGSFREHIGERLPERVPERVTLDIPKEEAYAVPVTPEPPAAGGSAEETEEAQDKPLRASPSLLEDSPLYLAYEWLDRAEQVRDASQAVLVIAARSLPDT